MQTSRTLTVVSSTRLVLLASFGDRMETQSSQICCAFSQTRSEFCSSRRSSHASQNSKFSSLYSDRRNSPNNRRPPANSTRKEGGGYNQDSNAIQPRYVIVIVILKFAHFYLIITLRAKLSGAVYCNRSGLLVCLFVCMFVGLLPR